MLSFTTDNHNILVVIPGFSGDSSLSVNGFSREIDAAVDRMVDRCKRDGLLMGFLGACESRANAYGSMFGNLKEVTQDQKWIRDIVGTEVCRRVLFLLFPNRFGFEKYGWIG